MRFAEFLKDQKVIRPQDPPADPKVSVIMPTYCRAHDGLLERAIASVLSQTFGDFEFIIVDDGSRDGTEDIVRDFQQRDARIIYVRHGLNSGLPALRVDEGILLSRGDHLAFAFDDDEWLPRFLEVVIAEAEKQRKRFVHCQAEYYLGDKLFHPRFPTVAHPYESLLKSNKIANASVVVHRSLLEARGLYNPHVVLRRSTDWELWLRLTQIELPHLVPQVLVRIHGDLPDSLARKAPPPDHEDLVSLTLLAFPSELSPQQITAFEVLSLEHYREVLGDERLARLYSNVVIPWLEEHRDDFVRHNIPMSEVIPPTACRSPDFRSAPFLIHPLSGDRDRLRHKAATEGTPPAYRNSRHKDSLSRQSYHSSHENLYTVRRRHMPNFLVTCTDRTPSAELGAIIPLAELQKRGLCLFRYKNELNLSLADIAWCDILLVVRGGISPLSSHYTEKAKELGRKVLCYWDDDLLGIPEYSLIYPYLSIREVKENLLNHIRTADAFFTPSPKLADKLSAIRGDEVKVLPVPCGLETIRPPQFRDTTPVVGYAGGPDHLRLLNSFLVPVLAATTAVNHNFRAHIIGPKPDELDGLPVATIYTPHISNYYDYLAFESKLSWDIGLAPQWEHEFTTYKFYNKLLEYAHIGCAGIYTKIEPYTAAIQDGITGLLVPNEIDAWRDAIIRLIKDPDLRYRIARNAYDFVIANHNRDAVAEGYAQALAPFLNYKAPPVSRAYLVTVGFADKFTSFWQFGMKHIKTYGLWYVLRRAPGYLLRMLARRL